MNTHATLTTKEQEADWEECATLDEHLVKDNLVLAYE